MKKVLSILLSVTYPFLLFAQDVSPSAKVLAGYKNETLSQMNDEQMKWLNFLGDKMCIVSLNPDKAAGLEDIYHRLPNEQPAETITDTESFNPFIYGIEPKENENQYFRVGDSGYTVFVYSTQRLQVMYDRYKMADGK